MKAPSLRFPQFNGEWGEQKLGNLLTFKNGINAPKEKYGKGVKFVNVLDILNNDYITADKIIGSVDVDQETVDKNSVEYGDVLFQRSSETREEAGMANVYLDCSQRATFGGFVIRGKKIGDYDPIFMNKLLKTSKARKEISTRAGGSTRYNVGQDILSEIKLLFPSLKEQEKIGSFFFQLDQKIELLQEKIEQLELLKIGMMQKVFSQEIRFKDVDGREFPRWRETRLGNIVKSKKKGTEARYSDSGNILLNNEYLEFGNQIKYVSNTVDVYEKDILILWDGSQAGKVYTGYKGVLGSTFIAIELEKENDNNFVYYRLLFDRNRIQKVWREGSGVPHVAKDFIKNYPLLVPNLAEQQKIGSFLKSIDKKVNKEKEKKETLIEQKKGFLQQMFV